jgi:Peptidyl-prolyl cis-trans isomerase (rotamase) - cyclophilin family
MKALPLFCNHFDLLFQSPNSLISGKLISSQHEQLSMMQFRSYLAVSILILAVASVGSVSAADSGTKVLLETSQGNITLQLYSDMPITTGNFQSLVEKKFYDGLIFHRVIDGFMIQGGDPEGTGMGGPGYEIKDEFTDHNKNDRGTIAMANSGPNTGGSQFFINLVDNNYLDSKHPAFGKVIEGMDVVDAIGKVKTDSNDRPLTEVKIIKATIIS